MKLAKLTLDGYRVSIDYLGSGKIYLNDVISESIEYKRHQAHFLRFIYTNRFFDKSNEEILKITGADYIPKESNYTRPDEELLAREILLNKGYELIHAYPLSANTIIEIHKLP